MGLAVVSSATAAFLYGLVSKGCTKPKVLPPYEEIRRPTSTLQACLREVDRTLYDALYRNGTRERDVFFSRVEPRRTAGENWEFTEMLVRCKDRRGARRLAELIRKALLEIGKPPVLEMRPGAPHRILLGIRTQGMLTHSIILDFGMGSLSPGGASRPRVAIVIDDLGYDPVLARGFMELNLPLALSILPRAPFTRKIAQEAARRGIPLMLHLPMEPRNYPETRPGPGALLLCMSREEILKVVDEDLARVPGAAGVNNHMGSLFTEDREKMGIVLGELKRRNLFFVDSRTTKRSVAYTLAKEMGLPALQRQVFLDNRASKSEVRIQLDRLRSIAGRSGRALGIGHPHKETLETLEEDAAWLQKAAQVVPVEALLGETAKGVRR